MPQFPTPPGGEAALVALIKRILDQQLAQRAKAFRIPVRNADPASSDPTNLWALEDGRIRFRGDDGTVYDHDFNPPVPTRSTDPAASTGIDIWVRGDTRKLCVRTPAGIWRVAFEGTGTSSDSGGSSSSSSKSKPTPTRRKTYRRTYSATWAATYRGNGAKRSQGNPTYYGRIDGTHGEQKAMIGFNAAAIQTDLAGATIRKVEVFLNNRHTYYNAGATLHLGGHNNGSSPNSYSGIVARSKTRRQWGKPDASWRTVADWFGWRFKAGDIKGIIIDQPGNNLAFYGYCNGTDTKLRITYTA